MKRLKAFTFFALLIGPVMLASTSYAAGWHNGDYYIGGSWADDRGWEGWGLLGAIMDGSLWRKAKPEVPITGGSVKEANAPDPSKCSGGYRWGRVTPNDVITKIDC